MQNLRNKIIAVAAIGVLAGIGSIMTPHHATAQTAPTTGPSGSAPVTIVSPVPLPITVSGTVASTQSGLWNIRNLDAPGRQPFQAFPSIDVNGNQLSYTFPAVPAGKRLVVEYISADALAIGGAPTPAVLHFAVLDGQNHVFHLPAVQTATSRFEGSGQVRAYVDGGRQVSIIFTFSPGGSSLIGSAFLSGYLVDCSGANPCATIAP